MASRCTVRARGPRSLARLRKTQATIDRETSGRATLCAHVAIPNPRPARANSPGPCALLCLLSPSSHQHRVSQTCVRLVDFASAPVLRHYCTMRAIAVAAAASPALLRRSNLRPSQRLLLQHLSRPSSSASRGVVDHLRTRPEWPGHLAFALAGLSFVVGDMLWLRIFATTACTSHIVFNIFHPVGRTLWLPIRWNAFYVAVNTVYVCRILSERFVHLDAEERAVYQQHFANILDEPEFKMLVALGQWATTESREVVIRKGQRNRRLILIVDGPRPLIELSDRGSSGPKESERLVLSQLDRSSVFGEASFLHGNKPIASVWLEPGTRYIAWDRDELDARLGRDSQAFRGLQVLVSYQLCAKLSNTTEVLRRTASSRL